MAIKYPTGFVMSMFVMALRREIVYYRRYGSELALSIGFLLGSMIAVAWIFSAESMTDMPIGVIDLDGSSVSRAYVRMLEATPEMYVREHLVSRNDASELLQQASIYAAVLIPQGFGEHVKTGRQTTVIAWHSGQFLTISGVLSKSLQQVTATLSAGIEMTSLTKRGDSRLSANVNFEPIRPELRTLFNPFQNYQYFLVAGLLPAMLQVFVMVWSVVVIGGIFRDHSRDAWLTSAKSIYVVTAAKLLPIFVISSVIGLACLGWIHGFAGWPVAGSFGMLILGWEVMICAYLVMGLLVVSFASKRATALSLTAAYTAPAFAYAGMTFPQSAMPLVAQIWTYALPLRSLLRLQVEQGQMGAPVSSSLPEIGILFAFVLLPLPFAMWQIQKRCKAITCARSS